MTSNARRSYWTALAAALLATAAMSTVAQTTATQDGAPPKAQVPRASSGEIVSIEPIRTRPKGSGVGAVAGGVVGGLIGHEVIGGTAATAIGAVGGAVAGNNLERNHKEGVSGYHVLVRMANGSSRTIDQTSVGSLRVGDRVRIQNGRIRRV